MLSCRLVRVCHLMQKPLLLASLVWFIFRHVYIESNMYRFRGEIEKDDNNNILIVENLIVKDR